MKSKERVKNILFNPKGEWAVIEGEDAPHIKVLTGYLILLALIPAITSFIGYGLIGYSGFGVQIHSVGWGIRQAVMQFAIMIGGVYLTAFIINALSEYFGSSKNFNRAFSTVAYAYTPVCVAGVFYILPSLSWIASLAGLYGLYLLYTGLAPMMKTPADKQTSYFVVSLICTLAVSVVLSFLLSAVLLKGAYPL